MTSHMAREVAEIPQASRRFLTESHDALMAAAAAMRGVDPGLIVTVKRPLGHSCATSSRTTCLMNPARSCQTRNVHSPGGKSLMANSPCAFVDAT